ncbi:MAG: dihydropteridine reductase [Oscillospiraceae bacterium]
MNRDDKDFIVQKIRTQYMEKDSSQEELDALKELDAEVKRPANVFGYVFGAVSAIIMGAGMSLVMTDVGAQLGISAPLVPGVIIGLIGLLMAIINYPIFKKILASRKEKYSGRILELSEKIMNKGE